MVFIYSPSACVFLLSLVLVSLFTLSSSSLFVLWLLMEVSVILFMGMMASEVHQSGESKAKFFLAQVFIGIGMFFILQMGGWESLKSGSTIFIVCLMLKMGVAPFHFWVPNVTKNLSWESLFVLLSFQKLPAMVIFGWGVSLDHHMGKFLAMGAITSGVLGQIYNDFNTMLAFTSMVTTIWLLVVGMLDPSLMIFCFLCYSGLLFFTLGALEKLNKFSATNSVGIWGLIMLAGSPGGPVFTIKWMVFCTLMGFGYLGEAVLLAISVITVVPLYLSLVMNVMLVPKYYGRYKKMSPLWLIGLPLFGVSFFWLPILVS